MNVGLLVTEGVVILKLEVGFILVWWPYQDSKFYFPESESVENSRL